MKITRMSAQSKADIAAAVKAYLIDVVVGINGEVKVVYIVELEGATGKTTMIKDNDGVDIFYSSKESAKSSVRVKNSKIPITLKPKLEEELKKTVCVVKIKIAKRYPFMEQIVGYKKWIESNAIFRSPLLYGVEGLETLYGVERLNIYSKITNMGVFALVYEGKEKELNALERVYKKWQRMTELKSSKERKLGGMDMELYVLNRAYQTLKLYSFNHLRPVGKITRTDKDRLLVSLFGQVKIQMLTGDLSSYDLNEGIAIR